MRKPFYNDQYFIAEQFMFVDMHTTQMAQIANQKINTLKLSYISAAYSKGRDEIFDLIKKSLMSYVSPDFVLYNEGFFNKEIDN